MRAGARAGMWAKSTLRVAPLLPPRGGETPITTALAAGAEPTTNAGACPPLCDQLSVSFLRPGELVLRFGRARACKSLK